MALEGLRDWTCMNLSMLTASFQENGALRLKCAQAEDISGCHIICCHASEECLRTSKAACRTWVGAFVKNVAQLLGVHRPLSRSKAAGKKQQLALVLTPWLVVSVHASL